MPSLKTRTALTTAYAAGLRASETVRRKVGDIDRERGVILVEHGKSGKDRYIMLSAQLLRILRIYWRLEKPKDWLFPGRDGSAPIDVQVLYSACRSARTAAGIRIIQVLPGHSNLSSTARYKKVSNGLIRRTESPLDRLRLEVVPSG